MPAAPGTIGPLPSGRSGIDPGPTPAAGGLTGPGRYETHLGSPLFRRVREGVRATTRYVPIRPGPGHAGRPLAQHVPVAVDGRPAASGTAPPVPGELGPGRHHGGPQGDGTSRAAARPGHGHRAARVHRIARGIERGRPLSAATRSSRTRRRFARTPPRAWRCRARRLTPWRRDVVRFASGSPSWCTAARDSPFRAAGLFVGLPHAFTMRRRGGRIATLASGHSVHQRLTIASSVVASSNPRSVRGCFATCRGSLACA